MRVKMIHPISPDERREVAFWVNYRPGSRGSYHEPPEDSDVEVESVELLECGDLTDEQIDQVEEWIMENLDYEAIAEEADEQDAEWEPYDPRA
jgi:hypothetical protein